jgi:hypothetical protein
VVAAAVTRLADEWVLSSSEGHNDVLESLLAYPTAAAVVVAGLIVAARDDRLLGERD